ncbi:hypothetical protein FACS1894125_1460 [Actinomycetota bacterium]|nr:hypothetical protein FACS1894125_1460 [Actinomycetota bacterium]
MTQSTENGATPSYNLDILHAQKYDLIAAVINWANKIFSELVVDNWILITLVLMLLICMTFLFDCQTITKLNNLNYQRFSTICLIFGVISVLQLVITPLSVASRVFMPFIMSLIILAIFLFGQIQQYLPSLKIILLPLLLTVGIIMQGMMYAAILPWQMVLESNIRSVHDGITNTIVLPPPLMVEYWHEPIVKDLLTQEHDTSWKSAFLRYYDLPSTTIVK